MATLDYKLHHLTTPTSEPKSMTITVGPICQWPTIAPRSIGFVENQYDPKHLGTHPFFVTGDGHVHSTATYITEIRGISSKEDGTPINGRDALNAILGTNGYYYETPPLITPEEIENNEYVNEAAINGMIADLEKKSIGLSGENLSMLMPDAVRTDTEGRLCIDYNAVVTMLVEAMKQQQEEIEALRQALQENGLLQK